MDASWHKPKPIGWRKSCDSRGQKGSCEGAMSEKIYALLLRLFPSHFRDLYGEEALQLFRDRAREETGFIRRTRLWLDLVVDLLISVPHECRHARQALASSSPHR